FPPFQAATLCLLANTAPVAWGGVGNPIRTLVGVTDLPEAALNAMAGRILPPLSVILPLWLVRSMVPWRETLEVWPALAVSGLSFGERDRKSTRLNSSHDQISYAVFCLKKKKTKRI